MLELPKHTANRLFYVTDVKDSKEPLESLGRLSHASGEREFVVSKTAETYPSFKKQEGDSNGITVAPSQALRA